MQQYAKHVLSTFYYTEYLQQKNLCYTQASQKIGQSLKESPRGMLVRKKIFWMSNKTFIEFGFRML